MTVSHWDSYRYFLAAADAGSLSAAALRLGVSQPTMSRQLSRLERRVGSRLFDRAPSGLRLTDTGARLVAGARDLERRAQTLDLQARGDDRMLAGKLVISTTEGLAAATLIPRLVELRRRLPDVAIELAISFELVDLLKGEADIVLRHTRPGSPELVGRRIGTIVYGLWATDAYLARHGSPRSTADLARHVVVQPAGELARITQAAELRRWAARTPQLAGNTMTVCAALVRSGAGIGTLPRYLAEPAPALRRVLGASVEWTSPLWLLTRRELARTARVRAATELLTASYRRARL